MNTQAQYLKAIYLTQQQDDGPASTGDVAELLDVSPASANEMIGKLEDQDLLDHEKYKGVDLTDEGIRLARDALQNYCIIERFLLEVLEVEEFHAEAKQLEGVIDETVAERLDTIIDRDPQCPDCFSAEDDVCDLIDIEAEIASD
jgi:Mn-dependent DtxR family transcriptional regulator